MLMSMTISRHSLAFAILAIVFFSIPSLTYAQATINETQSKGFVPLSDANFNKIFNVNPTGSGTDLGTFFNSAFRVALSLGAILAVMRIAWGGYKYMTTDASGEKNDAKEILTDVIIGMLLLLSIWLILYQINPCLLKLQIRGFTGTAYQGTTDQCAQR
jgi:hypothetical protein